MNTAKTTLIETIVWIWIIAGIVIFAGVFFVTSPLSYVMGEIAGSLTASLMMIQLYSSLNIELDLPEKKAVNHSRIMGVLRSVTEIGVLAASFYFSRWVMPYTVLAGLFGRKFAAVIVPFYEEFRQKRKGNLQDSCNDNKADR